MSVWLTADLHLNHARIIAYRPFDTVEAMNKTLVDNWNDRVQDGDTVWVLGDLAMGHLNETLPIVKQLKGYKCLISGNHDRTHPSYNPDPDKREAWKQRYREEAGIALIEDRVQIVLAGFSPWKILTCSHFPWKGAGDHTAEERFSEWRPQDTGDWLAHGHIHTEWAQRGRMVNVGVDVRDFAPVTLDEVEDIIRSAPEDGYPLVES